MKYRAILITLLYLSVTWSLLTQAHRYPARFWGFQVFGDEFVSEFYSFLTFYWIACWYYLVFFRCHSFASIRSFIASHSIFLFGWVRFVSRASVEAFAIIITNLSSRSILTLYFISQSLPFLVFSQNLL